MVGMSERDKIAERDEEMLSLSLREIERQHTKNFSLLRLFLKNFSITIRVYYISVYIGYSF